MEAVNKYGRIAIYIITGDANDMDGLLQNNVVDGVISKPVIKKELMGIIEGCLKN